MGWLLLLVPHHKVCAVPPKYWLDFGLLRRVDEDRAFSKVEVLAAQPHAKNSGSKLREAALD